jgi:hypothetical protein
MKLRTIKALSTIVGRLPDVLFARGFFCSVYSVHPDAFRFR